MKEHPSKTCGYCEIWIENEVNKEALKEAEEMSSYYKEYINELKEQVKQLQKVIKKYKLEETGIKKVGKGK